jgi:hypothetical protein
MIIGAITFIFDVVGPLVYAAIGSMLFLFLINLFSIHSDEEETHVTG